MLSPVRCATSLEAALEAGRFGSLQQELRLYRRIATLDASAPLPPVDDHSPTWAEASSFARELGVTRLVAGLEQRASAGA